MSGRRVWFVVVGVVMLVVGLALGKDRGGEESVVNTISAILLTVGFLTVVFFAGWLLVDRLRHRAATR